MSYLLRKVVLQDSYCLHNFLLLLLYCHYILVWHLRLCYEHKRKCHTSNQATGYASQHIWCLFQGRINWEGCVTKGILRKNGGMAEVGAPISLDGVAVHPDCWCICLCYLHFAPENPEDGEMYFLVLAHPGCPGQSSESHKRLCVCVCVCCTYATSMISICLSGGMWSYSATKSANQHTMW